MKLFLSIAIVFLFSMNVFAQQTIFDAARSGDITTLETILNKDATAVNQQDSKGYTPLILTVYNNQANAVAYLLEKGANVNAQDYSGNTALMGTAFKGYTAIAEKLLAYDAAVAVMNFNQATALTFAATFGANDIAALLLAHGANPHTKDTHGKSALDYATSQQNNVFVKLVAAQEKNAKKVQAKRVGSYMSNSIKTQDLHTNKPAPIAGCYMQ
tara:strand:+ start:33911 stop:34552 length:642 start_codon:yes stop_codon:yes gene_type:complete